MIHVLIEGSVQGVGFRQFVRSQANKLDIKGWVKNLPASPAGGPDRRVEAMFAGNRESLELMINYCREGPFLAQVKDLEIRELPDEVFESFEIVR